MHKALALLALPLAACATMPDAPTGSQLAIAAGSIGSAAQQAAAPAPLTMPAQPFIVTAPGPAGPATPFYVTPTPLGATVTPGIVTTGPYNPVHLSN
jgi:hypothetical protein